MARRRGKRGGWIGKGLAAVFRASHSVPAVGFLVAALLGVAWWKLRGSSVVAVQWIALGIGVVAVFFAVVAAAGFALILMERKGRSRRS
jgi:hypothetical protein